MQQILEIIPIVLFFIVYIRKGDTIEIGSFSHTLDGIYSATAVLMIAVVIQVFVTWVITRKLEKRLLFLLAVVIVTGGLTLVLRNNIFILWKPTIMNWAFCLAIIASYFIMDKQPAAKRLLGSQLQLPDLVWARLSNSLAIFFFIVGALNLVVAYSFSEATWVSYKLYTSIGFTVIMMIMVVAIIAPHIKEDDLKKSSDPGE